MFIGQSIMIKSSTDGQGHKVKGMPSTRDKITVIYADGSVQVSSGDVHQVVKGANGLVAIS